MKSKTSKIILTALALSTVAFAADQTSKDKNVDRLRAASMTFEEIMATPDKAIPQDLLERSHCVIIIPGMKKVGFIVGAKYGKGFIACRKHSGGRHLACINGYL